MCVALGVTVDEGVCVALGEGGGDFEGVCVVVAEGVCVTLGETEGVFVADGVTDVS